MKLKKQRDLVTCLGFIAVFSILPVFLGQSHYALSVLMNCAGLAVIASGVWLTFAIGRVNICQAGFALIGAYASAILLSRTGLSYWLVLPLSVLITALCGALIGSFILKLKGVYFSMLTISLTEAIRLAFLNGGRFTNGSAGITNLRQPLGIHSTFAIYYLGALLLALSLLVVWRMHYSRLGSIFEAIRLNEDLAESVGIDVWRYRILAFTVACALGGLGGSYFAVLTQSVYTQSFTVQHSIDFMLFCFLGGLEYVSGAMFGAFALTILFEFLGDFQQYQSLAYGAIMILAMLTIPNGILSLQIRRLRFGNKEVGA